MAEEVQAAAQTDEPRLSEPIRSRSGSYLATLWSSRLLIGITLAMMLVIGGVASLALGTIWFLPVALVGHFIATLIVVGFVFEMSTQVEHPAPETVAALEARGVRDPEGELNRQVGGIVDEAGEHRGRPVGSDRRA